VNARPAAETSFAVIQGASNAIPSNKKQLSVSRIQYRPSLSQALSIVIDKVHRFSQGETPVVQFTKQIENLVREAEVPLRISIFNCEGWFKNGRRPGAKRTFFSGHSSSFGVGTTSVGTVGEIPAISECTRGLCSCVLSELLSCSHNKHTWWILVVPLSDKGDDTAKGQTVTPPKVMSSRLIS
jgi:hypothetical protein